MRMLYRCLVFCLLTTALRGDDLQPPAKPLSERVEEAVKPAKDEFIKSKTAAIEKYKKALDAELEKATQRGSLEDVKAIKKELEELKADEAEWKIPAVKTAIKAYVASLDAAKKKYVAALDAVVKAQVQKKNIDMAEKVNELKEKGVDDLKEDSATTSGWINLIPHIDVQRDVVRGAWVLKDGVIQIDTSKAALLEIMYEPPSEYDYFISYTRLQGSASMAQIFSIDNKHVVWLMWWKSTSRLGGYPDTTVNHDFKLNKIYTSLIEVRKGTIKAYIDGTKALDIVIPSNLTDDSYWKLPNEKTLGIGIDVSPTIFHELRVKEVTGKGKFTRGEPKAQSRNSPYNEPADSSLEAITGKWTYEGTSGETLKVNILKDGHAELHISDKDIRQAKVIYENGVFVVGWPSARGGIVYQSIKPEGKSIIVETIRIQGNATDRVGRRFVSNRLE